VRGDLQVGDVGKIGMGVRRQGAGKQPIDPRPAEFARRQADIVDHQQRGGLVVRTLIKMRRRHLTNVGQPALFQFHAGFSLAESG